MNDRLEDDHLRDTVFKNNAETIKVINEATEVSDEAVITTLKEGIDHMQKMIVERNKQIKKDLPNKIK